MQNNINSFFPLIDVKDAWAGKEAHVLLSKIGAYKLYYWDINRVGPDMELESEVQLFYLNLFFAT